MLVSVIVPAYNADRTIGECIAAIEAQTWPELEIIVVDDGSTDRTAEIVKSFQKAQYLRQKNAGPAAARNKGAAGAKGEWLAFTDSDCVPHADWVERLMAKAGNGVAGIGGTYGIANRSSTLAMLVHCEIQMRHRLMPERVNFLGSFNCAYRKDIFTEAGGFDVSFRAASAEDNDLSYRLHYGGKSLLFTRDAIVDHYHPERLSAYLRTQMRHGFWRVKLHKKHRNRATAGDVYAGFAELVSPAFALVLVPMSVALLVFIVSATLAGANVWMYALIYLLLHVGLLFSHGVQSFILASLGAGKSALLFPFLRIIRDFYRGLGLAHGVLYFYLFRRSSP